MLGPRKRHQDQIGSELMLPSRLQLLTMAWTTKVWSDILDSALVVHCAGSRFGRRVYRPGKPESRLNAGLNPSQRRESWVLYNAMTRLKAPEVQRDKSAPRKEIQSPRERPFVVVKPRSPGKTNSGAQVFVPCLGPLFALVAISSLPVPANQRPRETIGSRIGAFTSILEVFPWTSRRGTSRSHRSPKFNVKLGRTL